MGWDFVKWIKKKNKLNKIKIGRKKKNECKGEKSLEKKTYTANFQSDNVKSHMLSRNIRLYSIVTDISDDGNTIKQK